MPSRLQAVSLAAAVLALACGSDDPKSQASARDRATAKSCDKLLACQAMGGDKRYDSRSSCEIDQRAQWEKAWPPAECDGHVDETALSICLQTIDLAECSSLLDWAQVLAKCPKSKICAA